MARGRARLGACKEKIRCLAIVLVVEPSHSWELGREKYVA